MAVKERSALRKSGGLRHNYSGLAQKGRRFAVVLKPRSSAQGNDMLSFFINFVVVGQLRACGHIPADSPLDMDMAKKYIEGCLNCREQLHRVCNRISELIGSRLTKELG